MKTVVLSSLTICVMGIAQVAVAGTQQEWSATAYFVATEPGELIGPPNGKQVRVGVRSHATRLHETGAMAGESASAWCDGMSMLDGAGAVTLGVGYCTSYYDNGDVLFQYYMTKPGQPGKWTLMGGTGRFEGATGSGTTTVTSRRSDNGAAWTQQTKGTITLK
jgi:hypothetical protein